MSYHSWLAVAAILIAPMTASAQSNSPEKSDAPAVTAPPYQSAFTNYQGFTEDEETPDTKWRAVNEEMAQLGGHVGHIKGGETGLSGASEQPKPDAKSDTAVDHSKHH